LALPLFKGYESAHFGTLPPPDDGDDGAAAGADSCSPTSFFEVMSAFLFNNPIK
jgi:hypothetical protein